MMMMSKLLKAAEDKAEPVMKNSRLENDFEQLFGPHFESGRKEAHSTRAAELRAYCATPQLPTMENPLQWWVRNQANFPRLAKLNPQRKGVLSGWKYHHPTARKPSSSTCG